MCTIRYLVNMFRPKGSGFQCTNPLQLLVKKSDPLFFLNNSLNIQCWTLKPSAMCFYWPVWHFHSLAWSMVFPEYIFAEYPRKNKGSNFSQGTVSCRCSIISVNIVKRRMFLETEGLQDLRAMATVVTLHVLSQKTYEVDWKTWTFLMFGWQWLLWNTEYI